MRPDRWDRMPASIQAEVRAVYEALVKSVVSGFKVDGNKPWPGDLSPEDQERASKLFLWGYLPDEHKFAMAEALYTIRLHTAKTIMGHAATALGVQRDLAVDDSSYRL